MVVEYRIHADEKFYVTAYERYRRQLWWYRWLRPVGVLIWLAMVAFAYFFRGAPADGFSLGLFIVLILGAALIFSTPLDTAILRRRIRKFPTLNDDWVIRLSDDGMSSSGRRGEGRLDWSCFSRVRQFADGFLLFQGPSLFHWFPDSACTPPALLSEVGDLVKRHVPDHRDVERRAPSGETQTTRGSAPAAGSEGA